MGSNLDDGLLTSPSFVQEELVLDLARKWRKEGAGEEREKPFSLFIRCKRSLMSQQFCRCCCANMNLLLESLLESASFCSSHVIVGTFNCLVVDAWSSNQSIIEVVMIRGCCWGWSARDQLEDSLCVKNRAVESSSVVAKRIRNVVKVKGSPQKS
jgi:hypothetical protein